jgi:hypothetical protein
VHVPLDAIVTVPVGVDFVPASVSVTATVQSLEVNRGTELGEHATAVLVVRLTAVTFVDPALVRCVLSPA